MNNVSSFTEILNKEGYLIYPINGTSMLPLLKDKESVVRLEKKDSYLKYDVVLYINKNNNYVLHRIIDIKDDIYYIKGDNASNIDLVKYDEILAKMVGYYKGEQYIDINDDEYQEYVSKYITDKKRYITSPSNVKITYTLNEAVKAAYRALLVYSVLPSKFSLERLKSLSNKDFYNLYLLAAYKKSDHILSDIVFKYNLDIDEKLKSQLKKVADLSKSRSLYQEHYKSEISSLFKEQHIKHLYFRGAELKDKYPNSYLRISNDIDIYVDKADLDKAREVLINKYHPYEYDTKTVHKTFNLPLGKVQVELHYALLEDYLDNVNNIIGDPFSHASMDKDNEYLYHMDNRYYYLYHLAHFAKHIKEGEYWISMLQDSYLLNEYSKNNPLVKDANLETFNDTINELLAYYFDEGKLTEKVASIEKIIYKDALDNYVLLNKAKYKNKFVYIFRRIFLTPSELATTYPSLKKHKYLYPIYLIRRLFKHKVNKPSTELKVYQELKKENLTNIYQVIGINF